MEYPHLKLLDWPFRIVPDEESSSFFADRVQFSKDLSDFLRNLSRRSTSSMHLMWAWFGAGKTHALRHVQYQCNRQYPSMTPVYTELPRSAHNFMDVYRLFISRIDLEKLSDAYMDVYTDPNSQALCKEIQFDYPDFVIALKKLMGSDQEQSIAIRWLRGEVSQTRDLRMIGLGRGLSTIEEASKVISWVIRLLSFAKIGNCDCRLIWMIDEFQRIQNCRPQVQAEINGCLHSIFNRCPNSLTIVISFSGKPESKKLPPWLSQEIRDRIGIEKVFLLPPLTLEDAEQFVLDVLAHFRKTQSATGQEYFPFTQQSVRDVVKTIKERSELKPRRIMQFFNAILEESDVLIERGEMNIIDPDFVKRTLDRRVFVDEEEST